MQEYQPEPLLVAVPEAGRLLGVSESLMWELVRDGEIRTIKVGRRTLVPRAELDAYVASRLVS